MRALRTATADLVQVPGVTLYAEKTGRGPALVLIPGGGGDAEMYADISPPLAERFTVITFDRRLVRANRREYPGLAWHPPLTAVRDTESAVLSTVDGVDVQQNH